MFKYKINGFVLALFYLVIISQAYSSVNNLDTQNTYSINEYSNILDKLLFFKNDKFKVFYGGPVSREGGLGAQWIMPVVFQDKHYKTRALYDLLFVNCEPETAKDAEVLFLSVSDINIKFKNLSSEDYNAFYKIISGKYSKNKYIVIRQTDFGMVYFPDIFISNLFSQHYDNDKKIIINFLNRKFGAKTDYKTVFKTRHKEIVATDDEQKIIYEPILIKTEINNNIYSYFVTKIILKNDNWKLYYVATKNKDYKNNSEGEALVRLDSGCVTGQIYGDQSCDCADQLYEALKSMIEYSGFGLVVHIPAHDGRGFGTALKAETEIYKLGGSGRVNETTYPLNTIEASTLLYGKKNQHDLRTFDGTASILKAINVKKVLLITDSVLKIKSLQHNGIKVTRIKTNSNKPSCIRHLAAKRNSSFYYPE